MASAAGPFSGARRWLAVAGLLVGVALVGYALFARPSDDEQIRDQLDRLAAAVSFAEGGSTPLRALHLRGEFAEIFTPQARAEVDEIGLRETGRDALVAAALQASSLARSLDVRFVSVRVTLAEDRGTARAIASAWVQAVRRGGDPDGGERAVGCHLVKTDGRVWQLTACRVFAPGDSAEVEDEAAEP
jgi:hypothetical protein